MKDNWTLDRALATHKELVGVMQNLKHKRNDYQDKISVAVEKYMETKDQSAREELKQNREVYDSQSKKINNITLQIRVLREIVEARISEEIGATFPNVLEAYAGKKAGAKTRDNFMAALTESFKERGIYVRVYISDWGYGLNVSNSVAGDFCIYFAQGHGFTDSFNRINGEVKLNENDCKHKDFPDDLEAWATSWLEAKERQAAEYEKFRERMAKEAEALNIGEVRLPCMPVSLIE